MLIAAHPVIFIDPLIPSATKLLQTPNLNRAERSKSALTGASRLALDGCTIKARMLNGSIKVVAASISAANRGE